MTWSEALLFALEDLQIRKNCVSIALRHNFIWTNYRGSVFYFGKNTFSLLAFSCSLSEVVSQQSELCVFRAQLRLRTFYFLGDVADGERDMQNLQAFCAALCVLRRQISLGKLRALYGTKVQTQKTAHKSLRVLQLCRTCRIPFCHQEILKQRTVGVHAASGTAACY